MKTSFDCLSCMIRQSLDGIRRAISDPDQRVIAARRMLRELSLLDFEASPPEQSGRLQKVLSEFSDDTNFYREEKARFTKVALDMLPALEQAVEESPDPFTSAVKLAVAGNVIDFGASDNVTVDGVRAVIESALKSPLLGVPEAFHEACTKARRILYLLDNAGETVFDRLLVERLPAGCVKLVARGAPILNDATLEDARMAGLDALAPVLSNGTFFPGTVLKHCPDAFQEEFARADLIVSKGQGNYESLRETDRPVFFLFRIKCSLVATDCGYPQGSNVVLRPYANG